MTEERPPATQPLPTREGWAAAEVGLPGWQVGQPGAEARLTPQGVEGPVLSGESRELAEAIVARYPTRRSALVPLLYLVQHEVGWVPRAGMREVGELLGLTTAEVEAVASFYTMLKLHPSGRFVISICTNPSCTLRGARDLYERARQLLGRDAEGVTEDGLFTLEEEECLAACDKAPVLTLNYVYYDRVTVEDLEAMIDAIRQGRVPEASRGGVPGDLREISLILAGATQAGAAVGVPSSPEADAAAEGAAAGEAQSHGPMGEGSPGGPESGSS